MPTASCTRAARPSWSTGRADGPPPARRTMSSHFAPRGPLPDADLRSASLIDADDVADLLGELGYPCEMEEAAERIAAIAGNDRQRSEEHTSELQSLMRIPY